MPLCFGNKHVFIKETVICNKHIFIKETVPQRQFGHSGDSAAAPANHASSSGHL